MRQLILMRHAQAQHPQHHQTDIQRPLTPLGTTQTHAAAQWLHQQNLQPQHILCSPAQRTRQTLQHLLTTLGNIPSQIIPDLYNATLQDLNRILHKHPQPLLLIGHNPSLEQLILQLCPPPLPPTFIGMPPAAIVVISLPQPPATPQLTHLWQHTTT